MSVCNTCTYNQNCHMYTGKKDKSMKERKLEKMMELNLNKEDSLNLLDLRKDEIVKLCLEKPVLSVQKSRVAVVMDFSGSMRKLYNNGTVQAVLERLLPIAMQFDDNGEMELWLFDNLFRRMPELTKDNYFGYVEREILSKKWHMGSTNYEPVMSDIVKKYTIEDIAQLANYIIFITDGSNFDKTATKNVLISSSKQPIFWQFIGIGNDRFEFLEKLDDLDGRFVDNANFFPLNDFQQINDYELYSRLLKEYPEWLELPEVKKMIESQKKKGLFGIFFK